MENNKEVGWLQQHFNYAIALNHEGKYQQAICAWSALLEGGEQNLPHPGLSERLIALSTLHRAKVNTTLNRYEVALKDLTSPLLISNLQTLNAEENYDYFATYGQVLGELSMIESMDKALHKALDLACQTLDDGQRSQWVWITLLEQANKAKAWHYLEKMSLLAITFARNAALPALSFRASWHRTRALKALGRTAHARQSAYQLLSGKQSPPPPVLHVG